MGTDRGAGRKEILSKWVEISQWNSRRLPLLMSYHGGIWWQVEDTRRIMGVSIRNSDGGCNTSYTLCPSNQGIEFRSLLR